MRTQLNGLKKEEKRELFKTTLNKIREQKITQETQQKNIKKSSKTNIKI